ncbi:LacI family DNA-binding transcriptional regulator [Serinibacter arcticus]|uniref:LacI family DNA-binding transcriptional regulator n=1 Tax=Serinibacter arcticus TaxID=1655435 RepID=UPI001F17ADE6|nr:LacI family DNA-binding transcriptional regulator [Serinibacter arcticus]
MSVRPTIAAVAAAAGVSRQTVSNALNAPERVKPDTLAKVLGHIDVLGYRPSVAARQMRTGRSQLLAMRIEPVRDGVNGVVGDRFLHALAEAAQAAGYRMLLCTAGSDVDEVAEYEQLLATMALDGVVLATTHTGDTRRAWLRDHGLAFMSFGRPWGDLAVAGASDSSWVDVDGAAGTAAATAELLRRGHRRIAYLGWPAGSDVGHDRRAGWLTTMAAAGRTDEAVEVTSEDDIEEALDVVEDLLRQRPTAIVCASDTLAVAASAVLNRRGLRPGPDVSVVGFDDTPAARALGIASVLQPLDQVAEACIAGLVAQLDGRPLPAEGVLLPPLLVPRTTLADPAP